MIKYCNAKHQSRFRLRLIALLPICALFALSACSANANNSANSNSGSNSQADSAKPAASSAVPQIPLASGTALPQVKTASLLKVGTDKNHEPTVTILDKTKKFAPNEQLTDVIIQGTGPVVEDGDSVTVQYIGIKYSTGAVFDSSYNRGGQPLTFAVENVIKGFKQMIVGQKVGSRIVSAFDSSLGYGPDTDPPSPTKGDMVFVVDIIGKTYPGR